MSGAKRRLLVVMGVSGAGKTTLGTRLAEQLDVAYADADDFHPAANVRKMAAGQPLDDADRAPWLDAIADWLARHADSGGVVSCSALKRQYRDRLRKASPHVFFVHPHGPEELLAQRMSGRSDHFMPSTLLRSQLDTLEPLEPDEPGVRVSVEGTPDETAERALAALPNAGGSASR